MKYFTAAEAMWTSVHIISHQNKNVNVNDDVVGDTMFCTIIEGNRKIVTFTEEYKYIK